MDFNKKIIKVAKCGILAEIVELIGPDEVTKVLYCIYL